jgi:hypothetical protein
MSPTEDELRAFVGPNADYYTSAFATAKPEDSLQRLGWNWVGFFLGPIWLLYRRMGRYIGYYLVAQLAPMVVMLMFPKSPAVALGSLTVGLLICLFFGAYGNGLYYRRATGIIAEARATSTNRQEYIEARGGVRWVGAIICAALMLAWIVGGSMIMAP